MNFCVIILSDFSVKKPSVIILRIFTVQKLVWLLNWTAEDIIHRNKCVQIRFVHRYWKAWD